MENETTLEHKIEPKPVKPKEDDPRQAERKEMRAWLYSKGVKALKITDEGIEAIKTWKKIADLPKYSIQLCLVGILALGFILGKLF